MNFPHRPVLVEEVVRDLVGRPEGLYVDGTVGTGGHAEAILTRLGEKGRLVGIDADPQALQIAQERLKKFGHRVRLVHGHYEDFPKFLGTGESVDGLLLDLGLSSLQLEGPERGFSFMHEGPLDMRMDPTLETTAASLLNQESEENLADLFWKWGEERASRRIAHVIVQARRKKRLETTADLAHLVERVIPRRGRIHPATRVFQALRIVVNDEIGRLSRFLDLFPERLAHGGRVAIISYHSLEDRLVKRSFRERSAEGILKILTKRPIRPVETEVAENRRSRSAKLRVGEKI